MIKWIKDRSKERTTWDGAVCINLGLMILFMATIGKNSGRIGYRLGSPGLSGNQSKH